jgi:hypothetical protein
MTNPVPDEESASATVRAGEIWVSSPLSLRTAYCVLVTTALPPRAAIGPAGPLTGHRAHGIRAKCG